MSADSISARESHSRGFGKWPHWTHFDGFALAMRRDGWTAKMQRNGSVFASVGNLVELGRRKLSQINIVARVASGTLVAALKARARSSRFVILHRTPRFWARRKCRAPSDKEER
jgi:hypothetical protein